MDSDSLWPMSESALEDYLKRMGSTARLNALDERRLSEVIRRGHEAQRLLEDEPRRENLPKRQIKALQEQIEVAQDARNQFMCANLRLVVSIAKRYPRPTGMELLDLVQEGNLGLERAVQLFDGRKGFKFSGYASIHIRNTITKALEGQGSLIKVPRAPRAALRAQMQDVGGDEQKLDALCRRIFNLTSPLYLDCPLSSDGGFLLADTIASQDLSPEQLLMDDASLRVVSSLLDRLPQRLGYILGQWLGLGAEGAQTQTNIAQELGVTPQAVSQSIIRALKMLSEYVHQQPSLWEDLADAS